jgi:hypothetical protein
MDIQLSLGEPHPARGVGIGREDSKVQTQHQRKAPIGMDLA